MDRLPVDSKFDVVIVGARCAGASLAYHLATAGVSVALLDAARLPSAQPMSTHLVQPPGMDQLDRIGLGAAVRRLSPALRVARLSFDDHEVQLPYGAGRAAHCLRRDTLDGLLQDAALAAGAQLRARCKVVDVLRSDDGRIRGVEFQQQGGLREQLRAELVVGADGRHSTIAKLVGAREYLAYDGPRACYWAYWRRPRSWDQSQLANVFRADDAYVVFPTDGDLLLIASAPPVSRAAAWRADHASAYLASLHSCPSIAAHVGDDGPRSEVLGMFRSRYYFRASAGPGWSLIGDAGHHKDFFAGLGISDALDDAYELSLAIIGGAPGALESWWHRRDVQRIEMFRWAAEIGDAEPVDALRRLTAMRLADAPHLQARFAQIFEGRLSPYDLIPPSSVVRWSTGALLRGDPRPLIGTFGVARRRSAAKRERRTRQKAGLERVAPRCVSHPHA